jgi:hypothetical protein
MENKIVEAIASFLDHNLEDINSAINVAEDNDQTIAALNFFSDKLYSAIALYDVAIDESSLKRTTTNRGFGYYEFLDKGGTVCTLQKSSAAMTVELVNTIEEHYVANNRMELTQEQVKNLLPILIKFVQTGEI